MSPCQPTDVLMGWSWITYLGNSGRSQQDRRFSARFHDLELTFDAVLVLLREGFYRRLVGRQCVDTGIDADELSRFEPLLRVLQNGLGCGLHLLGGIASRVGHGVEADVDQVAVIGIAVQLQRFLELGHVLARDCLQALALFLGDDLEALFRVGSEHHGRGLGLHRLAIGLVADLFGDDLVRCLEVPGHVVHRTVRFRVRGLGEASHQNEGSGKPIQQVVGVQLLGLVQPERGEDVLVHRVVAGIGDGVVRLDPGGSPAEVEGDLVQQDSLGEAGRLVAVRAVQDFGNVHVNLRRFGSGNEEVGTYCKRCFQKSLTFSNDQVRIVEVHNLIDIFVDGCEIGFRCCEFDQIVQSHVLRPSAICL